MTRAQTNLARHVHFGDIIKKALPRVGPSQHRLALFVNLAVEPQRYVLNAMLIPGTLALTVFLHEALCGL